LLEVRGDRRPVAAEVRVVELDMDHVIDSPAVVPELAARSRAAGKGRKGSDESREDEGSWHSQSHVGSPA
jgi:hypothetical protein